MWARPCGHVPAGTSSFRVVCAPYLRDRACGPPAIVLSQHLLIKRRARPPLGRTANPKGRARRCAPGLHDLKGREGRAGGACLAACGGRRMAGAFAQRSRVPHRVLGKTQFLAAVSACGHTSSNI